MNLAMQNPIEDWELRVIDANQCFLGKPKADNPNVLSPVFIAQCIIDPKAVNGNQRLIRNVLPIHWLSNVEELDVSGYTARIPMSKVGPVVVDAICEQLARLSDFLPTLAASENGRQVQ